LEDNKLKVDQALLLAKKKIKDGSLQEARMIYESILSKFPKNKRAQVELKRLSSKKINSNSIEPTQSELSYLVSLYNNTQFTQGLEEASRLLVSFPKSAYIQNIIGAINSKMGRFEAAVEAYKNATLVNPNFAEGFNNLGVAYYNLEKINDALLCYDKAITLKPNFADAYFNKGNALYNRGKTLEAAKAYKQAVKFNPEFVSAHNNLGNALRDLGRPEIALKAYQNALKLNPNHGNAKHMVSSLSGVNDQSAPRMFVESLFDQYAKNFDSSLINDLEYKIPQLITELILQKKSDHQLGSVLDLGCGTGIVGEQIHSYCSNLVGIDLSKNMLAQAKQKSIYNQLIHQDISEYLFQNELHFNFIIAADVFVYVGDLSNIFDLIQSKTSVPGKLVFSTEHVDGEGFNLNPSGRYSHSYDYIDQQCQRFNYTINHFSTTQLRKENNSFIKGGLYILDFRVD
jgi:predicted TPR repeat methyltransferase